ncbi:hypothetical protein PsYK624_054830 [Phanerochaete sordida]|uniref:Protein kinase domain-containing protein n=1 Tax=Phanerochaete sordida TaxID=48140 RepID=A0A9P3LCM4_9APHY|nr:hypothetical protein PsYK624_054830 [Phanerochaete sordida]
MAKTSLPYYLSSGSKLTFQHLQYGEMRATVLPFSASAFSTYHVVLVRIDDIKIPCAMFPGMELIVKIYDPRFNRCSPRAPWSEATEAAAARIHNGQLAFDPKHRPSLFLADPKGQPVEYEVLVYQTMAWFQRNELLAYTHLAPLQGALVPVCYGGGALELGGTAPPRAIAPPVVFLERVRDAVPLDAVPADRLTAPLLRALLDGADVLKAHGVIHTDANEANFLLAPAHRPARVVTIDFGDSWTRDAAEDEEDWEGAKEEWDTRHHRKVMLNRKFEGAGLPVPDFVALRLDK